MAGYSDYKRLSPAQNIARGFSAKARRYINPQTGDIITARQYENKRAGTTKEKKTKEIRAGKREYISPRQKQIELSKIRGREIRREINYITPQDIKLIKKYDKLKFKGLTDKEKQDFRQLFKKYPREQVLNLLGSPVVK